MKTWQDIYSHAKDRKNPLKLSSSEHRNLTKRVVKYLFEEGQANAKTGTNHSSAISVLKKLAGTVKAGGERHKAYLRAITELEGDEKLAAKAA